MMKIRKSEKGGRGIFLVPKINLEVKSYCNLITLNPCHFTEPPLLLELGDEDLGRVAIGSMVLNNIYRLSYHNQERTTKLVSDTSTKGYK